MRRINPGFDPTFDPDPIVRWEMRRARFQASERDPGRGPFVEAELQEITEVLLPLARSAGLDPLPFQRLIRHLERRGIRLEARDEETARLILEIEPLVYEVADLRSDAKSRLGAADRDSTESLARQLISEATSLHRFRTSTERHPVWHKILKRDEEWSRLRVLADYLSGKFDGLRGLAPSNKFLVLSDPSMADLPNLLLAAEARVANEWIRSRRDSLTQVRAAFCDRLRQLATPHPESFQASLEAVEVALRTEPEPEPDSRPMSIEWGRLEAQLCRDLASMEQERDERDVRGVEATALEHVEVTYSFDGQRAEAFDGYTRSVVKGKRSVFFFRHVVEADGREVSWTDLVRLDLEAARDELQSRLASSSSTDVTTPQMATKTESLQALGRRVRKALGKLRHHWHQDGSGARWDSRV